MMLGAFAALAAAGAVSTLGWTGAGEVYPPGTTLQIRVRTRMESDGTVVSESWPAELGEAKGLRRMTLRGDGGTIDRGGKSEPMPSAMYTEEQAQFGFYRQLQEAAAQAPAVAKAGANTLSIPGAVRTWFRIAQDGRLISAFNDLPGEDGKPVRQTFDFAGWWQDDGAIFPRRMVMKRSGQPYFTLNVESFDAR